MVGAGQDEAACGGVRDGWAVGDLEPDGAGAVVGVPGADLLGQLLHQHCAGGTVSDGADFVELAAVGGRRGGSGRVGQVTVAGGGHGPPGEQGCDLAAVHCCGLDVHAHQGVVEGAGKITLPR
ncbi:MAG: hypothetical protein QOE61_1592 [Micromonosporaceae bacterium]|nr:hypothetical protein [Micromonosporaceae bacterium]